MQMANVIAGNDPMNNNVSLWLNLLIVSKSSKQYMLLCIIPLSGKLILWSYFKQYVYTKGKKKSAHTQFYIDLL